MNIVTIIKILAIIAGICLFLLLILVNSKKIFRRITRIIAWTIFFWKVYGYKGSRWTVISCANIAMKSAKVRFLRRMKIIMPMFFLSSNSYNYLKANMNFFKEIHMDPPKELCEIFQSLIDLKGEMNDKSRIH